MKINPKTTSFARGFWVVCVNCVNCTNKKQNKKSHYPSCGSAARISAKNRRDYNGTRAHLIAQGYSPYVNCDP